MRCFVFLAPWNVDFPQRPVPGCRGLAGGSVAINKRSIISAEPPSLSLSPIDLILSLQPASTSGKPFYITITSHRLSYSPTHPSSYPILAQPPQNTATMATKSHQVSEAEVRSWGFPTAFTWTDGP